MPAAGHRLQKSGAMLRRLAGVKSAA